MSRTNSEKTQNRNTDVLVRAFEDEPLKLSLCERVGEAVRLRIVGTDRTVLFPQEDVYRFDQKRFKALRDSYEAGSQESLRELWGAAELLAS